MVLCPSQRLKILKCNNLAAAEQHGIIFPTDVNTICCRPSKLCALAPLSMLVPNSLCSPAPSSLSPAAHPEKNTTHGKPPIFTDSSHLQHGVLTSVPKGASYLPSSCMPALSWETKMLTRALAHNYSFSSESLPRNDILCTLPHPRATYHSFHYTIIITYINPLIFK